MLKPTIENILRVAINVAKGPDKFHIARALSRYYMLHKEKNDKHYTNLPRVSGPDQQIINVMHYGETIQGRDASVYIYARRFDNPDIGKYDHPFIYKFCVNVWDYPGRGHHAASYTKLKKYLLTPCIQRIELNKREFLITEPYRPIWATTYKKNNKGQNIYSAAEAVRYLEAPQRAEEVTEDDIITNLYY